MVGSCNAGERSNNAGQVRNWLRTSQSRPIANEISLVWGYYRIDRIPFSELANHDLEKKKLSPKKDSQSYRKSVQYLIVLDVTALCSLQEFPFFTLNAQSAFVILRDR
ncbi:hypothetical protein FPSE5266_20080 [Fusarium pseudograminearum]|nr:hypothetical protein FPSE5266_20080 [Fusarium pseudograminearum]